MRTQRVYQKRMAAAISDGDARRTPAPARRPSIRSPTTLAKPVMWMRDLARSGTWRAAARCAAAELAVVERARRSSVDRPAAARRSMLDLKLVRHQLADLAGALDVGAQLLEALRRAVVAVGDHRAAVEAVLGDRGPAGRRRPQRLHVRPVDARQQVHLVVELAQVPGTRRRRWCPWRLDHGDAQGIAQRRPDAFVRQVVGDVRMACAGSSSRSWPIAPVPRLVPAEQDREHSAEQATMQAVVEKRPLERANRSAGRGRPAIAPPLRCAMADSFMAPLCLAGQTQRRDATVAQQYDLFVVICRMPFRAGKAWRCHLAERAATTIARI